MKSSLMAAILLCGCCTPPARVSVSVPPPATLPTSGEAPSMFHEAPLPRGFPPAGPIGRLIVKTYPACRVATVRSADLGGAGQDGMFGPLFDHIQKENIPMTAPVQMDFVGAPGGGASAGPPGPPIAMSFLYGSPQIGKPGKDGVVIIQDLPAVTVISIGVRGSYDAEHFNMGLKAINTWLAAHPNSYRVVGPPRFLGYNSPFVPWFLRYGEVQVPVKPVGIR